MFKVLFLLSLLISSSLACQGGHSMIKETVNRIAAQLPNMIAKLANRKECQTSNVHPICSKGYKYWNEVSEAHYYKGVYNDYDNLDGFFDVVFDVFPFSKSDIDALKGILFLLEFTDTIDILGLDAIFQKYRTAKGSYFNLMFEPNCKTPFEYDFLITMINTQFTVGDEVFLVDYSEGNIFSGHSGQKVVKEPGILTYDQLDALMELFEISVYSNAKKIVDLLDGL